MLNQVTLQGRLVDDPKAATRIHTANGDRLKYSFVVASQDDYGKQATYYIPCNAWGKTGEFISKWFKKGNMILLTGKLTSYKDFEINDTRVELTVTKAEFPSSKEKNDDAPVEVEEEDLPF